MAKSKFVRAFVGSTNLFVAAEQTSIELEEEGPAASDGAINASKAWPSGPATGSDAQAKVDAPKPANDSGIAAGPVQVETALTRIVEAIGRHIARQHIQAHKAANDNDGQETA